MHNLFRYLIIPRSCPWPNGKNSMHDDTRRGATTYQIEIPLEWTEFVCFEMLGEHKICKHSYIRYAKCFPRFWPCHDRFLSIRLSFSSLMLKHVIESTRKLLRYSSFASAWEIVSLHDNFWNALWFIDGMDKDRIYIIYFQGGSLLRSKRTLFSCGMMRRWPTVGSCSFLSEVRSDVLFNYPSFPYK